MNWLKKKIKRKRDKNAIAILLPTSWEQLTDKQLYDVYGLANQPLSADQIKTICLFRWAKLRVNYQMDNGIYDCTVDGKKADLSATQIACAIKTINFISDVPTAIVRISQMKKKFNARPARIEGTSFREYIFLDNLYQGFINTQNMELLRQMTQILYDAPKLAPNQAEKISTFYWWTSLKQEMSKKFPHFFASADGEDNSLGKPSLHQKLSESMNAQIRALTGGDITKEKQVLDTDVWRALAELDAIAKEQQEMKQKYGKH